MAADDEIIGANIRRARKSAGMNQSELAAAMNGRGFTWRQNIVSRVEIGQRELLGTELEALEKILGKGLVRGTSIENSAKKIGGAFVNIRDRKTIDSMGRLHARIRTARAELTAAEAELDELLAYWHDDSQGDGESS
ncbi:Helix-turn-helix [Acidipropionibacterium jensenii]|uniref:Helix-turn-helix n=1 Tax=Acidipropionibacterium jensenii TaxID=1749 RepID=A0A3S4YXJ5_9ACTN|nr:helix-turn-helix transcriptional regulator [Acidipropionibacterium jensenii]VEI03485.1 Helix-turn-helix [Acidipropionibacterium jensenii]